jgi:hypothetical protein
MRTPDGHGVELDKFHTEPAVRADDIEAVLGRLRSHGAELVGEVVQYEDQISALLRPRP